MICQGIAGHLIDDIAFVGTDPAQVGLERDHAPISVEQRLLSISSTTASFVSGSKNRLSISRNASRHHSCGDIPLASFIGFVVAHHTEGHTRSKPILGSIELAPASYIEGTSEVVNQSLRLTQWARRNVPLWHKADVG